jgi:hypothetical protein
VTGVGTAAGLPPNAIANITMPDHIFHNPDMGQWGTCPAAVPDEGAGEVSQICNQVYREPFVGEDGKVHMRTRGSGWNDWPIVNDIFGPRMFDENDAEMVDAINSDSDHLCPSL